ncbi:MAG: hypothetical protein ACR2LI_09860 [Propionibacteriaceae bacterium]
MPVSLVVLLIAFVVAGVAARFLSAGLPLRSAARLWVADVVLVVVGLLGLVLHCTAMFFPALVLGLPGTDAAVAQINALGAASVAWYVLPVVVLMLGLRRVPRLAMLVLTVAFLAVGLTMYDGGPVDIHLIVIAATVLVIVATMAALVRPTVRT